MAHQGCPQLTQWLKQDRLYLLAMRGADCGPPLTAGPPNATRKPESFLLPSIVDSPAAGQLAEAQGSRLLPRWEGLGGVSQQ